MSIIVHTSSNAKLAYMSLQIKSIQLTRPTAAVAATSEAAASTSEGEPPIEKVATKEAEAALEVTCLD